MGIEQVKHALLRDLGGHGNLGRVEVGKAGADALGAGDHAADAGGNVVGALVAEDLQGHAGRGFALKAGSAGFSVHAWVRVVRKPPMAGPKPAQAMSTSMEGRSMSGTGDAAAVSQVSRATRPAGTRNFVLLTGPAAHAG